MTRFWCLLLLACAGARASDSDWPQWRYDAGRSAASPAELAADLRLQWRRVLPPPRPAHPYDVRLCYDLTYQPVAADGLLFVPSMRDDSVAAFDIQTGAPRWKFFAEGPVRFAPAAWKGKVYFTSDDGYLYCVRGRDGRRLWRVRGAPAKWRERKVLGYERMVSRWPALTGPVIARGRVYFAAGLWTNEGAYVCAVDAATGKLLWRNSDGSYASTGLVDHGLRTEGGVSPQGYLALIAGKLMVPCGRALPAVFDPDAGAMEPYTSGWGGRYGLAKGSWWIAGAGDCFFHSGDLFAARPGALIPPGPKPKGPFSPAQLAELSGLALDTVMKWVKEKKLPLVTRGGRTLIQLYSGRATYLAWWTPRRSAPGEAAALKERPRLQIAPMNKKEVGVFREPILTRTAAYYSKPARFARRPQDARYEEIVALDLTRPKWGLAVTQFHGAHPLAVWPVVRFEKSWSLRTNLKAFIKAGRRLYCGAKGVVAAVDIPRPGGPPRVSWRARIDGSPAAMLAAAGRLVVVTAEGDLYCFGPGEPPRARIADAEAPAGLIASWGPWAFPQKAEECQGSGPRRRRAALRGARAAWSDAFGYVLEFEDKALADAGADDALAGANGLTVEAWVKWEGPGFSAPGRQDPSSCVVGQRGPNSGFLLMIGKDGSGRFVINGLNTVKDPDRAIVQSRARLKKGEWAHLAGVYDPRGPTIRVFVNAAGAERRVAKPMHPSPTKLAIGTQTANGGYYWFQGQVARVRLYSRALSEKQIRAAYAEFKARRGRPRGDRADLAAARSLVRRAALDNGYGLALGAGPGRMLRNLLRCSRLRWIVLERDAAKVDALRREFDQAGLYGSWVHVLRGDLASIELPPYFASLVVAESGAPAGDMGDFAQRLRRCLRPYGGTACLRLSPAQSQRLTRLAAERKPPQIRIRREGAWTTMTRVGALPGADDWTHVTGGPGNTYASRDRAVRPPLGLLWFGGALHRIARWRENFTCAAAGGRLFLAWRNELYAADAYTGAQLWSRNLRMNPNTLAALPDALYAVNGGEILKLNAATGAADARFRVSDAAPGEGWAALLRVWSDWIVNATSAHRLVCLDRRTGRQVWSRKLRRDGLHLAVGGGRAYGVEYWRGTHARRGEEKREPPRVFALDIRTGEPLWERVIDLPAPDEPARWRKQFPPLPPLVGYSEAADALVVTAVYYTTLALRGRDGSVLWRGKIRIEERLSPYSSPRPPVVLSRLLNSQAGALYELRTGRKLAMRLWRFTTNYGTRGCGRALGGGRIITVRDAHASVFDLTTGCQLRFRGVRAACNFNLIPAEGLLLAPYKSYHCSCNYGVRTSFALAHMPEAARWIHAAAPGAALRARFDARPGQTLTARAAVRRIGEAPAAGRLRAELPRGWSGSPEPPAARLAAGRADALTAWRIVVPKFAKPGRYEVKLLVESPSLALEPSCVEIIVTKP